MYIIKWEKKWNESDEYVEKINERKIFAYEQGILFKILYLK